MSTEHSYSQANPQRTFHLVVLVYVLLLCMAAVSNSGLVKAAANALAISLFVLTGINWLFLTSKPRVAPGIAVALCVFYAGMLGSICFSTQDSNTVDTLKISLAPIFIVFGAAFERPNATWTLKMLGPRIALGLLIVAPLFAWTIQLATGATSFGGGKEVGIFANRNNAGLYALTLLAFYSVLKRQTVALPLVYLGVGLMFGTLGVLLAVLASLVLSHRKWRIFLLAGTGFVLVVTVVTRFPELSKSLRIQPVVDSIALLFSGKIDLGTVTYGELVRRLNTTDLSFLFRLKHWYNLANIYANGTPIEWFFGFGTGSSVRLSNIHLVPHNDYVRVLFEFGLLTFLGFVTLLFMTMKTIGRGWALVPFMAVTLYFFSENLINNYIAMVLFFYSAGAMTTRSADTAFPIGNRNG